MRVLLQHQFVRGLAWLAGAALAVVALVFAWVRSA